MRRVLYAERGAKFLNGMRKEDTCSFQVYDELMTLHGPKKPVIRPWS